MTLKSDAKFKEKLTYIFKCDLRNFVNFHPATEKFLTAMGYFCLKYMRFELKNIEKLLTLNSDGKFEYALTLCFQKWHEELGERLLEHSKV